MTFKLLSWNVEHFKAGDPARIARVVKHVKAQRPDVFGLLEMEGANVRQLMEVEFPTYDFFINDVGDVGIGTLSPVAKLDVNGRIRTKTLQIK